MDHLKDIISYIKNNISNNPEDIIAKIKNEFMILDNTTLTDKEILFLVTLCTENSDISNEVIEMLFLSNINKVEQKILVEANTVVKKKIPITLHNKLLSLFTENGIIQIIPDATVLLWNNEINFENKQTITNLSEVKAGHEDAYIKLFDYASFNSIKNQEKEVQNNNSDFFTLTKGFTRNFGIITDSDYGMKGNFQLVIKRGAEKSYVTISDVSYSGKTKTFLRDKQQVIDLKDDTDLKRFFNMFRSDIRNILMKNPNKSLTYSYLFLTNNVVFEQLNLFTNSLSTPIKNKKKYEYKIFQPVEERIDTFEVPIPTEPCEHNANYKNVISVYQTNDEALQQTTYFDALNDFIRKYINYDNGCAICNICGESVETLNIQGAFFIDRSKFLVTASDILSFPPYNKFFNLKFFMENARYEYTNYTKMGIHDILLVTRLLVDLLIHISSNRMEFEKKYQNDISSGSIFLLRMNNNFFEGIDVEKEKFKDEKIKFTNIPLYIIIMITASLNDYFDYYFLKKVANIYSINKDLTKIKFKHVIVRIIDSILKKSTEGYKEVNEKIRLERLAKTVDIYIEMMPEELKLRFRNKEVLFENYMIVLSKTKKQLSLPITTSPLNNFSTPEFNNMGQYLLNLLVLNTKSNDKITKYFSENRKTPYNINDLIDKQDRIKLKILSKSYTTPKTNSKNDTIFISLEEIYKSKNSNEVITRANNAISEIESIQKFKYKNEIGGIFLLGDGYIFRSNDISIIFNREDQLELIPVFETSDPDMYRGDYTLYKQELSNDEIINILNEFLYFCEDKIGKKINTDLNVFKDKIGNISRLNLFILKAKCLNLFLKSN